MTLEEKLQAMEALWDDLSRNPDILESPSWHEDILRERQQRLAAGEASFMDWEQAKAYIRSRADRSTSSLFGRHRGSLKIRGDIVAPPDDAWDAER